MAPQQNSLCSWLPAICSSPVFCLSNMNYSQKLDSVQFSLTCFTPPRVTYFIGPLFFSESDVALIIKYNFHDSQNQIESEDKSKKRKLNPVKAHSVIDYSSVKLPAPMFASYLDGDCQSFMHDCLR